MQDKLSEVVLILVGSTLIILLLIGLIVFALFIGQKRRFLYRQQLIDIKYQYEQEVLKTQLETQAQTFQTISQELHDNVGTLISIAIVHLKSFPANVTSKGIEESGKLLDEALEILRDVSKSINPDNITRLGLVQSFKNELQRIHKTKVFTTEFKLEGTEFEIPPQHQMILFRIVQESLNNILKHSGGDYVSVVVKFIPPLMEVVINDNGKGFSPREQNPGGSGLTNMAKRAKIINATLTIESENNKGTRVHLVYPGGEAKMP